ncbi:MAG: DUF805 domain-containing protein [Prevotellaceae bacterium]|jgi:uncharacterized membrane protein YhaH (DUF805 family)|nr:DUF805 domain-containing protein [Prevotellaceae bacterium]
MKWYLKVWKQYADFSGRARRKEYWMFALFNMLFVAAIFILAVFIFTIIVPENETIQQGRAIYFMDESIYTVIVAIVGIYNLAVLIPGLAVTVRRLHDVGKSGWWIFISAIPLIGGIWLLVLLLTDSDDENQYGRNPKR